MYSKKKNGVRHFNAPKTSFKVPASVTPNEFDRESVQIKSLGFWMGRDVTSGIAKSYQFRKLLF